MWAAALIGGPDSSSEDCPNSVRAKALKVAQYLVTSHYRRIAITHRGESVIWDVALWRSSAFPAAWIVLAGYFADDREIRMPLERHRESIYFLSLEIENVRCFGGTQVLHLSDSNQRPARWTLLVGDNGVGKTTLLQCLSWMRPEPYFPPGQNTRESIQPWLHDQDPPDMAKLLRNGACSTTLKAEMVEIPTLDSRVSPNSRVTTGIQLSASNNALSDAQLTVNEPEKTGKPFVIAYAANRFMGNRNVDKLTNLDEREEAKRSDLLRVDSTELFDAAQVFSKLEHSALKGNVGSKRRLDSMKHALADILPFISDPKAIDIVDPEESSHGLTFRTEYGEIPLDGLSSGHRTATAWIIDLASRLLRQYPDSPQPLAEPAVVLIDEIDLHLHPRWQRKIMRQFSDHFKNVQFVATTHSPLLITSVSDVNVAVLKQTEEGDHVTIENDPGVIEGWRFDQVLVNLFELETARSLRVEGLMKERARLFEKTSIAPEEEVRLREIADELSSLPTAERVEDQEAMQIIRHAAASIRAQREEQT